MKSRKGGYVLSPVGSPPSDNESGAAAAAAAAAAGCGSSTGYCGGGDSPAKEQDRFLPIANVSRIMKRSLPANAKISKEAKETVQECVSEFISFVTGEASDKCQREKRKTINGDDLLWAMTTLGFEAYVGPLKSYLNRYREAEGEKAAVLGGAGARHGDGAANDGGLLAAGGTVTAPGAAGDRAGHDDVGLMMGVSVGFSAGGGTSYYASAAAAAGKAYGGDGSKVVEFDGEEENGGGMQRGFGGHLHGAVQW
ncbi:Nuclear transcription factor Y subunit B-3 [Dichanthelium oligosanthes]|uniref:Nuclear transcription factor Y subunit B-3 n=1 Tax=Dichanthelium oligosanthes TaxID=888268 RepID=A0A1E5VQE8_9POAL|nr:Nuclear transcription factor Y subunit B-3 [Dichanthelium oligosanthes]